MNDPEVEFERAWKRVLDLHRLIVRDANERMEAALKLQRKDHERCESLERENAELRQEVRALQSLLKDRDTEIRRTQSQRFAVQVPPDDPFSFASRPEERRTVSERTGPPRDEMMQLKQASRRLNRDLDSVDSRGSVPQKPVVTGNDDDIICLGGTDSRNTSRRAQDEDIWSSKPQQPNLKFPRSDRVDYATEAMKEVQRERRLRHQIMNLSDFEDDTGPTQPPPQGQRQQQQQQQSSADPSYVVSREPSSYSGAGVFFLFYREPTVYALLYTPTNPQSKRYGKLVEFGGHKEAVDNDQPILTASRELREETECVLNIHPERLDHSNHIFNRRSGYHLYFYLTRQSISVDSLRSKRRNYHAIPARDLLTNQGLRNQLFERMTETEGFWSMLQSEVDRMYCVCQKSTVERRSRQQDSFTVNSGVRGPMMQQPETVQQMMRPAQQPQQQQQPMQVSGFADWHAPETSISVKCDNH